ncbi:MAG: hypothetical protein KGP35_03160 [Bacteroidetes bacterium]|nr:hypothetical protein [Bacteroidota bacterium]
MNGFVSYMNLLEEYLFHYQELPLPSLGSLKVHRKSASLKVFEQIILSGNYVIEFSEKDVPATHLLKWLVLKTGETIEFHNSRLSDWVSSLKEKLRQQGSWDWESVGTFQSEDTASIIFKSELQQLKGYEAIPAIQIIRQEASPDVLVGDKIFTGNEMKAILEDRKKIIPAGSLKWLVGLLIIFMLALIVLFIRNPSLLHLHQWQPSFEKKNPPATHSIISSNE